ncbi:MAG: hypothetical protein ABMB14_32475, partial [Myxococcota bacterium]
LRAEDLATDPVLATRVERLVASGALRIDLGRLPPAELATLAAATLPVGPEIAARIAECCGGRPMVVRQLVAGWVERGLVALGPDGRATLTDPDAAFAEPMEPAAVVGRRITGLAAGSARPHRLIDLVHLVALAGRTVPRALFDGFAGQELADPAATWGLFDVGEDEVAIASSELHAWLAALAAARPDAGYLQRRLGRAWGRLASDRGGALDAGLQAVRGDDAGFGVPWLLRAAARAAAHGRISELERASTAAVGAIGDAPGLDSLLGTALLWRARAHEARGELVAAVERFVEAQRTLDGAGDTGLALDAAIGLGWVRLALGEVEAADAVFGQVVAAARQAELLGPEARAIAGKAWIEQHKRSFENADVLYARVVARCAQTGDRRGVAEALGGQALTARRCGRFDDAEALYREAIAAHRAARDPIGELRARLGWCAVRRQRGADDAGRELVLVVGQARGLGAMGLLAEARVALGDLARVAGDRPRADRLYVEAAAWAARSGGASDLAVHANLGRARLAIDADDLTVAYEHTRRVADLLARSAGHPAWPAYRLVVATLLAHRLDHTQTWQWLWSAQEGGVADAVDRDTASSLVSICEVAERAGWANVLRLAGKLGVEQLERLHDEVSAVRLRQKVAAGLL